LWEGQVFFSCVLLSAIDRSWNNLLLSAEYSIWNITLLLAVDSIYDITLLSPVNINDVVKPAVCDFSKSRFSTYYNVLVPNTTNTPWKNEHHSSAGFDTVSNFVTLCTYTAIHSWMYCELNLTAHWKRHI
jgi:hypothetical protein